MAELPRKEFSGESKPLLLDESIGERALGLNWDLKIDQICVKVKIPDKPQTRRGVLLEFHPHFDPLCVVALVLVESKLLLGDLENRESYKQITEVEAKCW